MRKTGMKCLFSESTQGQALLITRKEKRNKNFISVSFERRKSNLCLPQGRWGCSVVRTQLLVFEQRRRAELYAKHSEAQGIK